MPTRYASTTDLVTLGIVASSISSHATATKEAALDSASAFCDGYLRSRFTLPLSTWSTDLTECVCCLAAETLLNTAGHNPAAGRDDITSVRAERWRQWLRDLANGLVTIDATDATPTDTSDDAEASAGVVASYTAKRGWRRR